MRVVCSRRHNIVHCVSGQGSGNQPANEHARDGRIAVGKVKDVRLLLFRRPTNLVGQLHSLKSGIADVVVVACLEATQSRNGIDADSPEIMRPRLEERKYVRSQLDDLCQKIRVADFRELRALLLA